MRESQNYLTNTSTHIYLQVVPNKLASKNKTWNMLHGLWLLTVLCCVVLCCWLDLTWWHFRPSLRSVPLSHSHIRSFSSLSFFCHGSISPASSHASGMYVCIWSLWMLQDFCGNTRILYYESLPQKLTATFIKFDLEIPFWANN